MLKYILAILLLVSTAQAADRLITSDGDRVISSDGDVIYLSGGADVVWENGYYQSPATSADTVDSSDTAGNAGAALMAAAAAGGDLFVKIDADTGFLAGVIFEGATLTMSEFNGVPLGVLSGDVKNISMYNEAVYIGYASEFTNNLIYNPSGDETDIATGVTPTWVTSIYDGTDPKWRNPAIGDFRLKANSPAKKIGTRYGQTVDITGRTITNFNIGPHDHIMPGSALREIILKK